MLATSRSLTGGQVVSDEVGLKLDQVGLEVLGTRPPHRGRPRTPPRSSTAAATRPRSQDRVSQIQAEIENTDSDWDREKLQERLAKLAGGVCVIRVGAATEVELKEKKHRIEDAISATRAAIEEGIVAGGGSALVHAAAGARRRPRPDRRRGDRRGRGAQARSTSRCAGSRENAGLEGYVVVAKVRELGPGNGFNAATGEYGDLVAQGVIDPVKVTRSAVHNAASIAGMLLTTETLVVDKPEEEEDNGRCGSRPRPRSRRSHALIRCDDCQAPLRSASGNPVQGPCPANWRDRALPCGHGNWRCRGRALPCLPPMRKLAGRQWPVGR